MSQEWSRVVSLKSLLKSIYEKSSDLSGTIVYSKYPGMLSPSRNLVSSGPDNDGQGWFQLKFNSSLFELDINASQACFGTHCISLYAAPQLSL